MIHKLNCEHRVVDSFCEHCDSQTCVHVINALKSDHAAALAKLDETHDKWQRAERAVDRLNSEASAAQARIKELEQTIQEFYSDHTEEAVEAKIQSLESRNKELEITNGHLFDIQCQSDRDHADERERLWKEKDYAYSTLGSLAWQHQKKRADDLESKLALAT